MGRGQNPNSRKALEENRAKGQFRGERAVEAAKKSNKKQAEYRTHKEILKEFGSMKLLPIGDFAEILSAKMPNITFKEAVDVAMLVQAANGNKAAADYCRDTEGEKPTDKVDVRATTTFEDFIDGINS